MATFINVKCQSEKLEMSFACSRMAVFCTNHHLQGPSSQMGNFVFGCLCPKLMGFDCVYHRIITFLFLHLLRFFFLWLLFPSPLHSSPLFTLLSYTIYLPKGSSFPLLSALDTVLFCESVEVKELKNPA